jgi:uncharacterized membrane protein (UPF0182 family)
LPELQRVVAVLSGCVAMEPTLRAALESVFGAPLALNQGSSTDAATSVGTPSPRELALSTQEHLQRAQEALFAGDRARHDRELQAAHADLQCLSEFTK